MDAPKVSDLLIKTGSTTADKISFNDGDVIFDAATGSCAVAIDNSLTPITYNYTDTICAPEKTVHTRITSKDGICSRCGAPLNSNYDCEYCGAKYKFEEVY